MAQPILTNFNHLTSFQACDQAIDQFRTEVYCEGLMAFGHASLAIISGLALAVLFSTVCFVGLGLIIASFYTGGGLVGAVTFVVHNAILSALVGSLIAYHPIKVVSGYFFDLAQSHWIMARCTLPNQIHLIELHKAQL